MVEVTLVESDSVPTWMLVEGRLSIPAVARRALAVSEVMKRLGSSAIEVARETSGVVRPGTTLTAPVGRVLVGVGMPPTLCRILRRFMMESRSAAEVPESWSMDMGARATCSAGIAETVRGPSRRRRVWRRILSGARIAG